MFFIVRANFPIICCMGHYTKISKGKKNQDISKSKNPLFFMESSNISEEKYVKYMLEQIKSPKRVYELLLIDFYQIGFVLKEKYKYLSIS